jgi:hypothetical protein
MHFRNSIMVGIRNLNPPSFFARIQILRPVGAAAALARGVTSARPMPHTSAHTVISLVVVVFLVSFFACSPLDSRD